MSNCCGYVHVSITALCRARHNRSISARSVGVVRRSSKTAHDHSAQPRQGLRVLPDHLPSQALPKRGFGTLTGKTARTKRRNEGPSIGPSVLRQTDSLHERLAVLKRRLARTMRMLFPGRASAVREVGALSDLDNISVRIADVAARLAVFGDRLRDELRSSTFP
jgi:hypothetical protein